MFRSRTVNNKECVADGMDDSLDCGNASHPAVKIVVCSEVPSSKPHENVVPHAEQPDERKVGKRDDAGTVRGIAKNLSFLGFETRSQR